MLQNTCLFNLLFFVCYIETNVTGWNGRKSQVGFVSKKKKVFRSIILIVWASVSHLSLLIPWSLVRHACFWSVAERCGEPAVGTAVRRHRRRTWSVHRSTRRLWKWIKREREWKGKATENSYRTKQSEDQWHGPVLVDFERCPKSFLSRWPNLDREMIREQTTINEPYFDAKLLITLMTTLDAARDRLENGKQQLRRWFTNRK